MERLIELTKAARRDGNIPLFFKVGHKIGYHMKAKSPSMIFLGLEVYVSDLAGDNEVQLHVSNPWVDPYTTTLKEL